MVILPLFIDFRNVNFSQKPSYLCLYLPTPIDLICVNLYLASNDSIDQITFNILSYQLPISTYRLINLGLI